MKKPLKSTGLIFLSILCMAFIVLPSHAQYFLMQDSTCKADIELKGQDFEKDSIKEMTETVMEEMSEKSFKLNKDKDQKVAQNLNDGKVFPDQLYFDVKLSRKGYLFKQCTAHVKLKRSKNYRVKESDETLYEGSSTRQFPRLTFKGNERCVRAIQDAFIHIPSCRTTASN